MKKKLLVLGIALVMAMSLAVLSACSGAADKNVGTYKIESIMGQSAEEWSKLAGQDVTELFQIELKSGGKSTWLMNGETQDVDYKVDGEKISFTDGKDTVDGTLKDGVISLEQDGMEMSFKKVEDKK